MNIVKAQITIVGSRPLLQHEFNANSIPLSPKERTGVAGNDPTEWKSSCMVGINGQLYVRGDYFFSMLRNAAVFTKKGRKSLQNDLGSTLRILEDRVYLENRYMPVSGDPPLGKESGADVYIDVCGVVNPSTKGRNIRYRVAASVGWKLKFTILWDKTIISREQMRAIANDAGILIGLGDGRKFGSGRFSVEAFEELDAQTATSA